LYGFYLHTVKIQYYIGNAVKYDPEGVSQRYTEQKKWQIKPDSTVPVVSGNSTGFSG
jgi:hypothetical protein